MHPAERQAYQQYRPLRLGISPVVAICWRSLAANRGQHAANACGAAESKNWRVRLLLEIFCQTVISIYACLLKKVLQNPLFRGWRRQSISLKFNPRIVTQASERGANRRGRHSEFDFLKFAVTGSATANQFWRLQMKSRATGKKNWPAKGRETMMTALDELKQYPSVDALKPALRRLCERFGLIARLDVLTAVHEGTRQAICFLKLDSQEKEQVLMKTLGVGRFGGEIVFVLDLNMEMHSEDEGPSSQWAEFQEFDLPAGPRQAGFQLGQ
ncbi:MAG: hypothetical protein ABIR35_00025, partial [Polaromonas sp.]